MGYSHTRIFIYSMACIDDIVSLGYCPGEVSTSGLTLMQAPGMSPINADKIATEQYVRGYNLLQVKKQLAQKFVRNDFIGTLQANNIATTVTDKVYDSSVFVPGVDMGTYAGYRGVKIHGVSAGIRGDLRKLKIKAIQCYPLASGDGTIHIVDMVSGVESVTSIAVTFVANSINTFTLPEPYICQNKDVAVLIDNTTINFCSAKVTCKKGCNGDINNPCAWSDGWNGAAEVKSEGYGINVQFFCHCDYDSLLCDFAAAFIGELIWLKMQILVLDDQVKTNRFNNWVIYNRTEILEVWIPDLESKYAMKFNNMVAGGMLKMLEQYNDSCLNCRGIRQVTNV